MNKLPLKVIVVDQEQPRKYFAADKMAKLRGSIEKEGIISPLIVEEMGNDKYLLIDGERRYRVATELGLKEVPVVIEKPRDLKDRLLRQFAIQEQHEDWTPVEKAMALRNLSDILGTTLPEVCKIIGATRAETGRYVAFSEIVNKDAYVKSQIPLDWALGMMSVRRAAKQISEEVLEEKFERSDERKFEAKTIRLIQEGEIVERWSLIRLKDAFKKDPKMINKYIEDEKSTPSSLFALSKAKGAFHLRNTINNAMYVASHGHAFLALKDVKITSEQITVFKNAITVLKKLIDLAE